MSTDEERPIFHFLVTFLAGGTSAAIAITAIAPLERVKLILQVQKGAYHIPSEREYKGIIDCFRRIPKEQGFFSLWRGNWAGVLRCFPYQALNFSIKELFKEKFIPKSDNFWHTFLGNIFSGGVAGSVALTAIYPLDYARTRLAVDIGPKDSRQFRSVSHCLISTYKEFGLKSIYRGFVFSVFGVFIYRSLYFGLYDTIMECVRPEYAHSLWVEFPAAELSSTSAGIVSYPLDTVRRHMMMQNFNSQRQFKHDHQYKSVHYTSTMDCWRKIYKAEGVRGFFHGGLTNLYRGTGGAIMLVLYDNIQHWLLGDHPAFSQYIPPKPQVITEDVPEEISAFKRPCKVFKDRCVFCNF